MSYDWRISARVASVSLVLMEYPLCPDHPQTEKGRCRTPRDANSDKRDHIRAVVGDVDPRSEAAGKQQCQHDRFFWPAWQYRDLLTPFLTAHKGSGRNHLDRLASSQRTLKRERSSNPPLIARRSKPLPPGRPSRVHQTSGAGWRSECRTGARGRLQGGNARRDPLLEGIVG